MGRFPEDIELRELALDFLHDLIDIHSGVGSDQLGQDLACYQSRRDTFEEGLWIANYNDACLGHTGERRYAAVGDGNHSHSLARCLPSRFDGCTTVRLDAYRQYYVASPDTSQGIDAESPGRIKNDRLPAEPRQRIGKMLCHWMLCAQAKAEEISALGKDTGSSRQLHRVRTFPEPRDFGCQRARDDSDR
ncbi:hypothetical protein MPLA_680013 [Mesorhizobium sp. ORS 3359]|nr:hypothetical protein MPLA_680013 [Mesorhizobium sp. ORS 3359]